MISDRLQQIRANQMFPYDLLRWTRPELILDVGAANGALSAGMKHRSPSSRIIAFEPFAGNFPMMHKHLDGLEGVSIVKAAVSDRSGKGTFIAGTANAEGYSPLGHLVPGEVDENSAHGAVDVVRIDDIVSEPVVFLKIDVQGGEAAVLRGAKHTLDRGVDFCLFEFDGDVSTLEEFDRRGYDLYDNEYLSFSPDTTTFEKLATQRADVALTTGGSARKGHILRDIPRDLAGYAKWIASIPLLYTDVLAVRPSARERFESALASWQAWRG